MELLYKNFLDETFDKDGMLIDAKLHAPDTYNFGFDVIDAIAERTPDKKALVWLSKNKEKREFTFSDISKMSNQVANYLTSLGIKKGDKVMLVLKRHYQFWTVMPALEKIGAIAIPSTVQLMKHDFVYRFNTAGVDAIISTVDDNVHVEIENAIEEYGKDIIKACVNGVLDGWIDFDKEVAKCSDVFSRPSGESELFSDEYSLMYFSSGTTSYPKIVAHTHTYSIGHILTAKYWHNVNSNGLHYVISDTGWGKAVWGKMYGQWLCEACVLAYDFDKFVATDILELFGELKITTFCAPPTMYRFFIKEDLSRYDFSSLEYATTAGEALNPEVFNKFYEYTGIKLMEGFGQTETTLLIANIVGMNPNPGSMGKPSPQFDVKLLDADDNEVIAGEPGEICVNISSGRPMGIFACYYNDEEKSKACISNGFYHTGDVAWKDENGYLWYEGRTDDLIKSSGYRISPFEIESVIIELPYVLECAVVGVSDEVRGQIIKASVLLVEGTEKSEAIKKEIQDYVKTNTAPYKYPRIVDLVDELPKTISGKIRKVELRESK